MDGNKEIQVDSHKEDLPVDKATDENLTNSDEMHKAAIEGLKSMQDSQIVAVPIHVAPSEDVAKEVNPVDRKST